MVVKTDNRSAIRMQKGRAKTFLFDVKNQDLSARNMTGETALFTIRDEYGSGTIVKQLSLSGGEAGAVFASGRVAVSLGPADFSLVTFQPGEPEVTLAWDLQITTAGSVKLGTVFNAYRTGLLVLEQGIT